MSTRRPFANDVRGFTLVELLISMSILAVMTSFTVTNYRVGKQSDELRQGSQILASQLRRAQTMALAGEGIFLCAGNGGSCTSDASCGSGQKCLQGTCVSTSTRTCTTNADCTGGTTCVRSYPTGYGVRVSSAAGSNLQSILFADIDGDRAYDATEVLRTERLSPGPFVTMSAVSPASANALDIVFAPPKPTVYFNGSIATAIATLTVRHSTTGSTRTVRINRITGQISAD